MLYSQNIVRFMCIFFMIFVHTFGNLLICLQDFATVSQFQLSIYYCIDSIFGSMFFAPVLIILAGQYIMDKINKENIREIVRFGLLLIFFQFCLNFARGVLPCLIFPSESFNVGGTYDIFGLLFQNDILSFFGFSCILLSLLLKIKFNYYFVLVVAVIFSLSGFLYSPIYIDNDVLSSILGFFINTNSSYFSLTSWFIIFVSGLMFFFVLQIKKINLNKYYTVSLIASILVACLIFFIYSYLFNYSLSLSFENFFYWFSEVFLNWHDYACPNIFIATFLISSALFFISFIFFISKIIYPKLDKFFGILSISVLRIFCISWVIIGWLSAILCWSCELKYINIADISFYWLFAIALIIILVSTVVALLYYRYKKITSDQFYIPLGG